MMKNKSWWRTKQISPDVNVQYVPRPCRLSFINLCARRQTMHHFVQSNAQELTGIQYQRSKATSTEQPTDSIMQYSWIFKFQSATCVAKSCYVRRTITTHVTGDWQGWWRHRSPNGNGWRNPAVQDCSYKSMSHGVSTEDSITWSVLMEMEGQY